MYCIYGKNKVGQAVAKLCEHQNILYEMIDDNDNVTSFSKYEAIIPSPGVPGTHPIYATGKVIAELDFAYQFLPEKFQIVSITGTDGKSTTAWITYNILQKEFFGKKSVYLSGNFDIPFSATVLDILQKQEKKGIIVIEISSFMSYWIGRNHGKMGRWEDGGTNSKPMTQGVREPMIPGSHDPMNPRSFHSDYTIFTNLKSDHLNWHRDLQEYLDAKMNLVKYTSKKAIINEEVLEFAREKGLKITLPENVRVFKGMRYEVGSMKYGENIPLKRGKDSPVSVANKGVGFGEAKQTPLNPPLTGGSISKDFTDGENILISGRKKYKLSETHFNGFHNAMNLLSVGLLANEMGICSKRMKQYFSEITGLPHRLEKIGEKNGITFVEDSKSTSSQSLEAALGSYNPPVKGGSPIGQGGLVSGNANSEIQKNPPVSPLQRGVEQKNLLLIVGGSDKGDTFTHLAPRFHERVKAMVAIGATKEQFLTIAKQEGIPHLATDSMDEAVKWLYGQGSAGDVLMLSPGCASFGLFRDYLDRANRFREVVRKI